MKPLDTVGLAFLSILAAQTPDAGRLMTVEGNISIERAQLPPRYLRVVLDPVGAGNELSTEVRSDGTFTIGSVAPGHWRVSASGTMFSFSSIFMIGTGLRIGDRVVSGRREAEFIVLDRSNFAKPDLIKSRELVVAPRPAPNCPFAYNRRRLWCMPVDLLNF